MKDYHDMLNSLKDKVVDAAGKAGETVTNAANKVVSDEMRDKVAGAAHAVGDRAKYASRMTRITYLLRHFIDTRPEQAGCVRAFRHFSMTLVDKVLKKFQEHNGLFVLLSPASIRTRMTNRTDRMYLNQQSILVAILFHGNHVQEIAALLAFCPKTVLDRKSVV